MDTVNRMLFWYSRIFWQKSGMGKTKNRMNVEEKGSQSI